MRQDLDFHLRANDYFGTLATVLDLIGQDLQRQGDRRHAARLADICGDLVDLQHSCRIEILGRAAE
jgi:hypothetical protein